MMKINPAVDATLSELAAHGAEAEVDVTRRHVKIAWATGDGRRGLLFTSKTPSDQRSATNARGVARRALRGHDERTGVPPSVDASPQQKRVSERMRQPPHPPHPPRIKTIAPGGLRPARPPAARAVVPARRGAEPPAN